MTISLTVRNVNAALAEVLRMLKYLHIQEHSRNGPVLTLPEPIALTYKHPEENILLGAYRNANPFFHYIEAMWMLAGRNDVESMVRFNRRMASYSDDGKIFHGAYGFRWRKIFENNVSINNPDRSIMLIEGGDQLTGIVELLKTTPNTRRAVLSMWHPPEDLNRDTLDVPCNTHAYFNIRADQLHMTVCNRSNDILWGMCGANAVHFSILQMYLAERIGVGLGTYTQFSNNAHVYTDVLPLEKFDPMILDAESSNLYDSQHVSPPIVFGPTFAADNRQFFRDLSDTGCSVSLDVKSPAVVIAQHLANSWSTKAIDREITMNVAGKTPHGYWRRGAEQWLTQYYYRREEKGL